MSRISKMASDTEIRLQNTRVGLDLRRRPARDGPAPVEDHDVVAEVHHEVHVVLDDDSGKPCPSSFHVGTVAETAEELSQASAPKRDQHVVQHREPGEDAAEL